MPHAAVLDGLAAGLLADNIECRVLQGAAQARVITTAFADQPPVLVVEE